MIFALAESDQKTVMDARNDEAGEDGICIYCGRAVYLTTVTIAGKSDGGSYCHDTEREAASCLKARSFFPR